MSVTVKVATPFVPVVALDGETTALPVKPVSVTFLPGTTVPPESLSVTVIVDCVDPSSATVLGEALTVEALAEAAPWNTTVVVPRTMPPSVVSVAVYVTDSAVVSFTVNVTEPLVVVDGLVVITELPALAVRATWVLDVTSVFVASFKVTVIVEVVVPSFGTLDNDAATVECTGLGTELPKTTATVCVMPVAV